MDFIVNGTAMDLLISIARSIKNDVEQFLAIKEADNSLVSFKNLTPFAQRIEFFEHSTDYKRYREVLRQWILYGQISYWGDWGLPNWETTVDMIEADAAKRAGQVYDLRGVLALPKVEWEEATVKSLVEMRHMLLEQNPILSDQNIDIHARRALLDAALRGNEEYQDYQRRFDHMVKKAISSLITQLLLGGKKHSEYKRVVEGL